MKESEVVVAQPQSLDMFNSSESFNTVFTMAKTLAGSTIIPATFRGNVSNVMIAIDMSKRMNANPLMVMQNIYIVHGNPSWSAKFLIACINASGKFATPLRYEFVGTPGKDDWGCYAYAIDKKGEVLKGSTVTIDTAKKSGWYNKEGSKWKIEPEQMLRYRAATRFQTAYCPEISCGLPTREELEDGYASYEEVSTQQQDNLNPVEEAPQGETTKVDVDNPQNDAEGGITEVPKPETDKPDTGKEGTKPMGKQPVPESLFD